MNPAELAMATAAGFNLHHCIYAAGRIVGLGGFFACMMFSNELLMKQIREHYREKIG
jgi:hypothetical protein